MRRPAPLPAESAAARPAAPAESGRPSTRDEQPAVRDLAPPAPLVPPSAQSAARPEPLAPPATRPEPAAQPAPPAWAPASAGPDIATAAPSLDAIEQDRDPDLDAIEQDPDLDGLDALPEHVSVREVWAAARARRKALRAEVRRFTVRQRRRRMVWIGAIGALVLLVLGTLGAAYSPLFAVEQISVVGTESLDAATVEAALSDQLGTPLARVDSSAVKAALVQFPLVESYALEARPPHELVVRIVERTPIGSIESAAGYTLVDAAGVALATTPQPDAGHPVITATGGVGSPAFTAVGTVYRSLPDDIRAQVTAMSATTANDVTLTLGGTGTEVVWGNADDSAYKAVVLASAMTARPPDTVYSYDVSSPNAVVIR